MTPWSADKRGGCGFDAPPTHIPPEGLAIVGFLSDQFLRSRAWTSSPTRHSYGGQDRFGQPRPSATIMTFEPLPILVRPTPVPLSSLGRNCHPERLVLIPVCCAHPVRSTVAAKCRPRYYPPSRPGSAASRWSAICMCEERPSKYNLLAAQTEFHSRFAGHPLACVQAPATASTPVAGSPPIARRSVHVGSCPQFSASP
jgi:hypothetical protein